MLQSRFDPAMPVITLFASAFAALIIVHSTSAAPAQRSLCAPGERVVFSCHLTESKKTVSLCASPKLSPSSDYVQYRFGSAKGVELVYPAEKRLAKTAFGLYHTQFLRASSYGISFELGGFDYSLEYQANGPDPKDDAYALSVQKGTDSAFGDTCDIPTVTGKDAFYPLETLSRRLGIPITEKSEDY